MKAQAQAQTTSTQQHSTCEEIKCITNNGDFRERDFNLILIVAEMHFKMN